MFLILSALFTARMLHSILLTNINYLYFLIMFAKFSACKIVTMYLNIGTHSHIYFYDIRAAVSGIKATCFATSSFRVRNIESNKVFILSTHCFGFDILDELG